MSTWCFNYYLSQPELLWSCSLCSLPPLSDSIFEEYNILTGENICNVEPNLSDLSPMEHFISCNAECTYILYFNCRRLLPVVDQLRTLFEDYRPFIIAITESWLNRSTANLEVNISVYSRIRPNAKTEHNQELLFVFGTDANIRDNSTWKIPMLKLFVLNSRLENWLIYLRVFIESHYLTTELFGYLDDLVRSATTRRFEIILVGDLNCDFLNKDNTHKQG